MTYPALAFQLVKSLAFSLAVVLCVSCSGSSDSASTTEDQIGTMPDDSDSFDATPPEGFSFAADIGETVKIAGTMDVAYGANGSFVYLRDVTSDLQCQGSTFGVADAAVGSHFCYVKALESIEQEPVPVESDLYVKVGDDPVWQDVLDSGNLSPLGEHTTTGFTGSVIDVKNALVEVGPYASDRNVTDTLRIHTLGNPSLPPSEAPNWSRWYQADGDTEIFRLFQDEESVSNDRTQAARIEAFDTADRWMPQPGVWREFTARYTIIEADGCGFVPAHTCSIFQAKGNNTDHWSVMLRLDGNGDIWFTPRVGEAFILAKNMEGRGFDLRIRDNGLDYEMYVDGILKGKGQWQRTEEIGFRWGIYVGASDVVGDVMIFISGAKAYSSHPPEGYIYAANAGEEVSVSGRVDIAFGAAGQFNYLYGRTADVACNAETFGDPSPGVDKQCFTRISADASAPQGYVFIADEDESFEVKGTMNIAFGADGNFNYRYNLYCDRDCSEMTVACDIATFGDPAPWVEKQCYYQSVPAFDGPSGYQFAALENEVIQPTMPLNLALGAEGQYVYLENQDEPVTCDSVSFGSDPIPGTVKQCYKQQVFQQVEVDPPVEEIASPDCVSETFDPRGDVAKLKVALQQATNTGNPVTLTGTYLIASDIKVLIKKDLTVDATAAEFIAIGDLDGDMFSFDTSDSVSLECDSADQLANITWTGGYFDMSDAMVSTVVPITSLTPEGREGTSATADALSFRGATKNGTHKLGHLTVEYVTFRGTSNDTDPYYLAGGDSGILMTGASRATIRSNKFFGVRDAAVYLSAGGASGEFGGNFTITDNYVERAYDGVTSKRGADGIRMEGNSFDDVVVGLSIKRVYDGWTADGVEIVNNDVNNAVRPISVERADNVTITGNTITGLGGIVAGSSSPTNKYGAQYEGIALNGVQGANLISGNSIQGVTGSRADSTTTWGVVQRFEDGRETTGTVIQGNSYENLDQNIQAL